MKLLKEPNIISVTDPGFTILYGLNLVTRNVIRSQSWQLFLSNLWQSDIQQNKQFRYLIGNSFEIRVDTTLALVLACAATMMTHLAQLSSLLSTSLDNIGHCCLCHILSAIVLSSRSDQICGLQRTCTGNSFTERKHLRPPAELNLGSDQAELFCWG